MGLQTSAGEDDSEVGDRLVIKNGYDKKEQHSHNVVEHECAIRDSKP